MQPSVNKLLWIFGVNRWFYLTLITITWEQDMEHVVKSGEYLSKIAADYGLSLTKLLAANPRFKADPNSIRVGDNLIIPQEGGDTVVASSDANIQDAQDSQDDTADDFTVPEGQLTFDAEGLETRGQYFSRSPHVPGSSSGVTIGRGYDMKERSKSEIIEDLTNAGVSMERAERLSECRGLSGQVARNYLAENDLNEIEITPSEQKALFNQTYQELEGDVIRICNKPDVVAKYGKTDWTNLNPIIKDIVVDLRYRGDYTGATRERVQPALVNNDLLALQDVISDRNYWVARRGVPGDRFDRRKEYIT
jgi:LysM repeat protein